MRKQEKINHPQHYGGADNAYEAIKVIEAWGLGFCLGNAVKYVCRAGHKVEEAAPLASELCAIEDLQKARWYIDRRIEGLRKRVEVLADVDRRLAEKKAAPRA